MLLSDVKKSITKNMEQYFRVPTDDILEEKIFEALLYVAAQCEPQVLLRYKNVDNDPLYRDLKNGYFIAIPEYPYLSLGTRSLQIDETLSYAVINYVCFMLSGKADFDALCTRWIFIFKKNDLNAFGGDEINED